MYPTIRLICLPMSKYTSEFAIFYECFYLLVLQYEPNLNQFPKIVLVNRLSELLDTHMP